MFNMPMTTSAETVIRRAKVTCRLSSGTSGGNFLGSTDETNLLTLAECLNDGIRDCMDEIPLLGVTEATLSITANSASTLLPSDLRQNEILALEWADTDDGSFGQAITLINQHQRDFLPDYMKSEDTTGKPDFCYVGWNVDGGAALYWLPRPDTDRTAKLTYRAEATAMEASDVGEEGSGVSVKTVPIPDAMIEMLVYAVARRIQERHKGQDDPGVAHFEGRFTIQVDKWIGRLAQSPHAMRLARVAFAGFPGTTANTSFNEVSSPTYERF